MAGFYRLLGITVTNEAELVGQATAELLRDGAVLERVEEVSVPDFAGDDADIADIAGDPSVQGTWYTSGYAFFAKDNDDGDD